MDNPEKLAGQGTQNEEKQNRNTTRYVFDTTMRKQTQITSIKHENIMKDNTTYKVQVTTIIYIFKK